MVAQEATAVFQVKDEDSLSKLEEEDGLVNDIKAKSIMLTNLFDRTIAICL